MKIIKAVKKLKFWSRKKKTKKKPFLTEQQPSSSSYSESSCHYYHHHHCHYYPVEPSAPPLPSWLDYTRTQETTISGTDHFASTTTTAAHSAMAGSSRVPFTTEDESVPGLVPSSQEEEINGKNSSYQQYMVENPVYVVPALPPQVTSERNVGAFGCVFSIGAHLLRCFFPCFHIREATK